MDASTRALKMLEWEQKKKELDALEAEIVESVLEAGTTQTVGHVRASYSKGRKTYDWKGAGQGASAEVVEKHTETSVKTKWRAVCKEAGIEDIPVMSEGEPSVSLKLLDKS